MKKFNKIFGVVLASCMTLSLLAGCGGDNNTKENQSGESQSTGSQDDTQNADNQTAGGEGVFKIGGIGPITGNNAVYGQAVQNAMQIAIDEINEAGGVNGYTFEMNFQDDESDPEKSVNAYNNLKDWGMQLLVGTVTSGPCVAVAAETNTDNMFQLTPSGSSVECVEHPNAFRVCFSDPNQGFGAAKYIGENSLGSKVAIIYDSSSIYSSGIYTKFTEEAANQNFEIVSAEAFTADNATDFSVQLQKAKDAGADLVFLPIYYTEASLILTQANQMGYEPTFVGCDGLDGILAVENFDLALAEDVILLTPFAADATDDLTVSFVTKYQEKHGDIPNQFAADAYDAVYIVKAAIEKSGATPDMSVSDLCEAIKGAMTGISVNGLTGEAITWTEDGEPNKAPRAVVIKDGAYVAM